MPIVKQLTTLPNTLRTFEAQGNDLGMIVGMIVSTKAFYFDDLAAFIDFDEWNSAISNKYITPLHNIKNFEDLSQDIQINDSKLNFTYLAFKGNPRYEASFMFDLAFHNIVDELTGTDLYVFFHDINWNLYGTSIDGNIRGFTTNRFILHDRLLQIGVNPAYSILDVELSDPSELNEYGVVQAVSFDPTDIDRLFSRVTAEFVDTDTLNLRVIYDGEEVTSSVEPSDITITDSINGELTFTSMLTGGVLQLTGFNKNLSIGKIEVLSALYLGCTKYTYIVTVEVTNNFVFEDGDNFVFEDGNNFIFEIQV